MGERGDVGQSVHSCSYVGWLSSRDPMYSMMIIVNITAVYTRNFPRE